MAHMDAHRKEASRKLGELKQAFAGEKHPSITDAFDLAESALVKAINGTDNNLTARDITKHMLKAMMDGGFMIMHRDEMQNAILAAAQAGKILREMPEQPTV